MAIVARCGAREYEVAEADAATASPVAQGGLTNGGVPSSRNLLVSGKVSGHRRGEHRRYGWRRPTDADGRADEPARTHDADDHDDLPRWGETHDPHVHRLDGRERRDGPDHEPGGGSKRPG
jgi:hypothetical protein